jgi:hypothetical protein
MCLIKCAFVGERNFNINVYFFILFIITEHGATRMAFGVERHNININININLLNPTGHVMHQQV